LVEGSEPSLFTERTGLAFSLLESRLAQAEEWASSSATGGVCDRAKEVAVS
jgi:hypothetical protein